MFQGVLPNHLNAFLDFCIRKRYFKLEEFCAAVNGFNYSDCESTSKPHLDMKVEDLKKQNNLGMPLTSMQVFNLFINLPFILKKLLQSSVFPQYEAILICVDILSLCFATTVTIDTPSQLSHCIKKHNAMFAEFYPTKMKFKFHFMSHFPQTMMDLGPLSYTSCLATERKHQFFKGNKVRNLKNPCLMLARRHELWACVNDHNQSGSLSHTALSHIPYAKADDKQPINDPTVQFVISNCSQLTFQPRSTLKVFHVNGQKYEKNTLLNLSSEYFPTEPTVGMIRWILYDGKNCAFVCSMYTIITYEEKVRGFQIQKTPNLKSFLLSDLVYKKPLNLIEINGLPYIHLHPYGKLMTLP